MPLRLYPGRKMSLRVTITTAGTGGKVIGTVFLLFFLGMGCVFAFLLTRQVMQSAQVFSWRETSCMIRQSEIQTPRKGGDTPYAVKISYEYSWAGRTLRGERVSTSSATFSDYARAQRMVDKYPAGATTVCFVNSADPTQAALERRVPWEAFALLLPLVFIGIGGGGIWAIWRGKKGPLKSQPASTATTNQPKPAVTGCFFLFFLLTGGAVGYFLLFQPLHGIIQARNWTPTPCEVLASSVQSHSGSESTTYSVNIFYTYEFNGRAYKSNRYKFMAGSSSGYDGKAAVVRRYPAGTRTVCYVNPRDPVEAVLERGFTADLWFGLIPLVFLGVGIAGLVWTFRRGRHRTATARSSPLLRSGSIRSLPGGGIPVVDNEAGPVTLHSKSSPLAQFCVGVGIAIFWNGIVSIFVFQAAKAWSRGRPEWILMIFLIPFVLIGLGMIAFVVYSFLRLFNPRPRLTLGTAAVPLGGTAEMSWHFAGAAGRIKNLRVQLEGREEATYRRGTSTNTDKHVFARVELASASRRDELRHGRVRVAIPADAMHSFEAANNKIVWVIRVHGEIDWWPDVNEEFSLIVLPHSAAPSFRV